MKIAQVMMSRGNGGLEKHVRELSSELANKGHEVVVISDEDFLKTLPKNIISQPINCQRSRRNPILLFELLTKLRTGNFDIIHAQASKAASIVSTIQRLLSCPTVGTLHNIKHNTRAYLNLNHIITVSKHLAASFPSEQVTVVYNGIALPQVKVITLENFFEFPNDYPILFSAGRLVKAKGFDVLLDAIDGLPVNLIIAGEGPEQTALEQRIRKLDPDTQCQLLGYRTDVSSLMAAADAVVISSRREGFSYVFSEALLTHSRVISTDVPVANEVLPANLIVPTANAPILRKTLRTMLEHRDEWDSLMQAAQKFSVQHMTLSGMTDKTLAVYQHMIKR